MRGIFFRSFYERKFYFNYMRCCSSRKYLQNLRSNFLSIKNFTTVNSAISIFTINFNNDFAITHVRYFRFKTGLSCENCFSQRSLLFVIVFHSSSTILPVNVVKIYICYLRTGRSVLEKYFVEVSKTARDRRSRDVIETETKYFSVRTDLNGK